MQPYYETLEFHRIREMLCEHALSHRAKAVLGNLEPALHEDTCRRKMAETTAARKLLDACGAPPLPAMQALDETLTLCEAGAMPVPGQLDHIRQFAAGCRRTKAYLHKAAAGDDTIAPYGRGIADLTELEREIERCIRGEVVDSEASPQLRDIRRRLEHTEGQIKEKLQHLLRTRKNQLSDGYIATRGGRYVLPVKRECKEQFGGTVVETSGKGGTVFMEPAAVARLQGELTALAVEEDGEVRRILYTLGAVVADAAPLMRRNGECIEVLDVLFAKAKLSAAMRARPVTITPERRMRIREGCHPLLDPAACVPLDFDIEAGTAGVIITGPNTGGKTVAVKTVGLLSLMAQCGLHIPCGQDTVIAMHDAYWCDIGDGQSIAENLSTFSGHMTAIIRILEGVTRDSLVLLDELGSGTDPAEGMGLAIAVLEELRARGCMFLVTTHYPQVKEYARAAADVQSARMAFDRESLRPLYRLEMGRDGESCALHIARRLGLPAHLLRRAQEEARRAGAGAPPPAPAAAGVCAPTDTPKSRLRRSEPPKDTPDISRRFAVGDSVAVSPTGEIGIVYRPADEMGEVIVQVKGRKQAVSHKRLQLKVPASELYPPDYDFSILFDPVEHRKARSRMRKHHVPGLELHLPPEG